jgi:hypothetical protein
MSLLIVEDGSVVQDANSYITETEFTDFCNLFGLSIPAATTSTMTEQAIIRGTAYLDGNYQFKGCKFWYNDPLEWPRYGVYDDLLISPTLMDDLYYKEIPTGLKKANCRAAYEEVVSPGCLQKVGASNVKRKKINVIETEWFSAEPSQKIYFSIEGFLKGLIQNKNMVTVRRT